MSTAADKNHTTTASSSTTAGNTAGSSGETKQSPKSHEQTQPVEKKQDHHRGGAAQKPHHHHQQQHRQPSPHAPPVHPPQPHHIPLVPHHPIPMLSPEDVFQALRHQLDYYFSRENLARDKFLLLKMNEQHYVEIAVIEQFNKVRQLLSLSEDKNLLRKVIPTCSNVTMDPTGTLLRPSNPSVIPKPGAQAEAVSGAAKRVIIMLRAIPASVGEKAVREIFDPKVCGEIVSVRSDVGDTWFIQFPTEEATEKVAQYLAGRKFQNKPLRFSVKTQRSAAAPSNSPAPVPPPPVAAAVVPPQSIPLGYPNGGYPFVFVPHLGWVMPHHSEPIPQQLQQQQGNHRRSPGGRSGPRSGGSSSQSSGSGTRRAGGDSRGGSRHPGSSSGSPTSSSSSGSTPSSPGGRNRRQPASQGGSGNRPSSRGSNSSKSTGSRGSSRARSGYQQQQVQSGTDQQQTPSRGRTSRDTSESTSSSSNTTSSPRQQKGGRGSNRRGGETGNGPASPGRNRRSGGSSAASGRGYNNSNQQQRGRNHSHQQQSRAPDLLNLDSFPALPGTAPIMSQPPIPAIALAKPARPNLYTRTEMAAIVNALATAGPAPIPPSGESHDQQARAAVLRPERPVTKCLISEHMPVMFPARPSPSLAARRGRRGSIPNLDITGGRYRSNSTASTGGRQRNPSTRGNRSRRPSRAGGEVSGQIPPLAPSAAPTPHTTGATAGGIRTPSPVLNFAAVAAGRASTRPAQRAPVPRAPVKDASTGGAQQQQSAAKGNNKPSLGGTQKQKAGKASPNSTAAEGKKKTAADLGKDGSKQEAGVSQSRPQQQQKQEPSPAAPASGQPAVEKSSGPLSYAQRLKMASAKAATAPAAQK